MKTDGVRNDPRRYFEKAAAVVALEEKVIVPKKMSPLIAPNWIRPSRVATTIAVLGILHRPTTDARSMAVNATSP